MTNLQSPVCPSYSCRNQERFIGGKAGEKTWAELILGHTNSTERFCKFFQWSGNYSVTRKLNHPVFWKVKPLEHMQLEHISKACKQWRWPLPSNYLIFLCHSSLVSSWMLEDSPQYRSFWASRFWISNLANNLGWHFSNLLYLMVLHRHCMANAPAVILT